MSRCPGRTRRLIQGDPAEAIGTLKRDEEHLTVIGSGELVRSLMGRALIDEFLLLIYPLVLGSGLRLFPDGAFARLELTNSLTTTTGVVIGTYRTAEKG